jgi:hypothetical protein
MSSFDSNRQQSGSTEKDDDISPQGSGSRLNSNEFINGALPSASSVSQASQESFQGTYVGGTCRDSTKSLDTDESSISLSSCMSRSSSSLSDECLKRLRRLRREAATSSSGDASDDDCGHLEDLSNEDTGKVLVINYPEIFCMARSNNMIV